jgi:hypothetical protein
MNISGKGMNWLFWGLEIFGEIFRMDVLLFDNYLVRYYQVLCLCELLVDFNYVNIGKPIIIKN